MRRSLPESSTGVNRRRRLAVTIRLVGVAAVVFATGCTLAPTARDAGPLRADAPDLAAIHDASSPGFRRACLGCHADIMKRATRDPRFKEAHAAMIPFLPDYDAKLGVTDANCVSCHARVDVIQHSGVQIRRNADVTGCEGCHGKTGPASKKFYAN